MTSTTSYLDDKQISKSIPTEWEKKSPEFRRMIPNVLRKYDPHKPDHDPMIRRIIIKSGNQAVIEWLDCHTLQGKFERLCDKMKNLGYDKLSHDDKIFIKRRVVSKKQNGEGALHNTSNLKMLKESGYPAHELNEKFTQEKKALWLIALAKKTPNKIPFDIAVADRVRFPDGKGDMNQFLKDNVIGGAYPPSDKFKAILKKIAPKWIGLLEQHKETGTADAKKQNNRDVAVKRLLDLAKLRPRVGADKHGGGFNDITISHEVTKWFRPLSKTKPKEFAEIQKQAPWWFGQSKKQMSYPVVCPYGGRHGARKLDLLDYAKNKKNKIYKFGLSKKAKTDTDVWMKSVFTYCNKARKKNGYDKKFHKELIAIRPEVEKLFPL